VTPVKTLVNVFVYVIKKRFYTGPLTLAIMLTYRCTASCKNCGTFSNPKQKEYLDKNSIAECIEIAREEGFKNVVFTGGEPTLRMNELLFGLQIASKFDFPTRLVTNAHWATSLKKAEKFISIFKRVGLAEINISTGPEHLKFIKFDNVINSIISSINNLMPVTLMIELKDKSEINKDTFLEHPKIKALDEDKIKYLGIIESPWTPINPFIVQNYPVGLSISSVNISRTTGCDNILQTFVLQPNGVIAACCGLGMRYIKEFQIANVNTEANFLGKAIMEAQKDVFKMILHIIGPEKILQWASSKDQSIKWENMYAHKCQACIRLFKDSKVKNIIFEYYKELLPEIFIRGSLLNYFIPNILSKKPIAC